MHDLHCKNADEMYSEVLAQRVTELKETAEGSESMCEALEKLVQEEVAQKARKTAKALNQEGMSIEKIAQVLGEDEETVRNWLSYE